MVTVEAQKHLEREELARQLESKRQKLESENADLRFSLDRMKEERVKREQRKKAMQEKKRTKFNPETDERADAMTMGGKLPMQAVRQPAAWRSNC